MPHLAPARGCGREFASQSFPFSGGGECPVSAREQMSASGASRSRRGRAVICVYRMISANNDRKTDASIAETAELGNGGVYATGPEGRSGAWLSASPVTRPSGAKRHRRWRA